MNLETFKTIQKMKNILLGFTLLLSCTIISAQSVVVYAGADFSGKSQSFAPGNYDMNVLNTGVGNDKIKSVQVPAGWKVTLYQNSGYGGTSVVLTGPTSNLSIQHASFGTKTSSLKIEASNSKHLTASLVGRWTFAGMSGPWDETENWKALKFNKGAKLTERGLELKGGAWAKVELDGEAMFPNSQIKEKTLISWVIMDDLKNTKPAGSILTLDSKTRDQFDGIIYGEGGPSTWTAGSNSLTRTERVNGQNPKTTATGKLVKMAVSYKDVGGKAEVKIYQDDVLKRTYTKGTIATWKQNEIEVLFGARHTINNATRGSLNATIVTAELHNKCLSSTEIAARKYTDPTSFIREAVALQSVNYPDRYMVAAGMINNGQPDLQKVTASSDIRVKNRASITIMPGLADAQHVSLVASVPSGAYIVAYSNGTVRTAFNDGTNAFRQAATFKKVAGLSGQGYSFESIAKPGFYLRHSGFKMIVSKNDGSALFKKDASFKPTDAFVPTRATETPLSSDGWYVISNAHYSPNKALGIRPDGKIGLVDVPRTGSIDHILWRLERPAQNVTNVNGLNKWRLVNKKVGKSKRLDSSKTGVLMANAGLYTGQYWAIRSIPWVGSDIFSMTNVFVESDSKNLDCGSNGLPRFGNENLDYVGQRWRFTFMHYRDGIQRPELPQSVKGIICGPNSVKNGKQPPLNHDNYKKWYPKYGSALGVDYVATEGVSDWAVQMSKTVLTNVLLGLKDHGQIEKFKGYRIIIVGDTDIDINNYPDFGWSLANEWRGGTNNLSARITEEMMCRTGVTNRPGDNDYREYDQVVHEFGHTIDMLLGLKGIIASVEKDNGTYPRSTRENPNPSYDAEQFPWWVQAWFDSASPWGAGGKRAGFMNGNSKVKVDFMKDWFSKNKEWKPFPVPRRYGK